MLNSRASPFRRRDLVAGRLEGRPAGPASPAHGAGDEGRGREGPGVAGDLPRPRPDQAGAAALPRRPGRARRGRGGRALRRRGAPAPDPPAPLVGLQARRGPLRGYSEGARLGIPVGLAVKTAAPIVALSARFNEATDEQRPRRPPALPALPRPASTPTSPTARIGGTEPNAADFQIATSDRPRPAPCDDLKPLIEPRPGRPTSRAAYVPNYPGKAHRSCPAGLGSPAAPRRRRGLWSWASHGGPGWL